MPAKIDIVRHRRSPPLSFLDQTALYWGLADYQPKKFVIEKLLGSLEAEMLWRQPDGRIPFSISFLSSGLQATLTDATRHRGFRLARHLPFENEAFFDVFQTLIGPTCLAIAGACETWQETWTQLDKSLTEIFPDFHKEVIAELERLQGEVQKGIGFSRPLLIEERPGKFSDLDVTERTLRSARKVPVERLINPLLSSGWAAGALCLVAAGDEPNARIVIEEHMVRLPLLSSSIKPYETLIEFISELLRSLHRPCQSVAISHPSVNVCCLLRLFLRRALSDRSVEVHCPDFLLGYHRFANFLHLIRQDAFPALWIGIEGVSMVRVVLVRTLEADDEAH